MNSYDKIYSLLLEEAFLLEQRKPTLGSKIKRVGKQVLRKGGAGLLIGTAIVGPKVAKSNLERHGRSVMRLVNPPADDSAERLEKMKQRTIANTKFAEYKQDRKTRKEIELHKKFSVPGRGKPPFRGGERRIAEPWK